MSRRRLARRSMRRTAWLWTEWLVSYFSFVCTGCPRDNRSLERALGPWKITERQEDAFYELYREICRSDAQAALLWHLLAAAAK